jgi:hypothetical protein
MGNSEARARQRDRGQRCGRCGRKIADGKGKLVAGAGVCCQRCSRRQDSTGTGSQAAR